MTVAIETKERPILFSGPMVRAILEGRKTMTRRVVKPQPAEGYPIYEFQGNYYVADMPDVRRGNWLKCPYGGIGTRLWVRETWLPEHPYSTSDYSTGPIYRADWLGSDIEESTLKAFGWKPSIHMPRSVSRITLEITGVRVERIQSITVKDAIAEGIEPIYPPGYTYLEVTTLNAFMTLWDGINLKRGYGWQQNPFVWVIEFKRIQP